MNPAAPLSFLALLLSLAIAPAAEKKMDLLGNPAGAATIEASAPKPDAAAMGAGDATAQANNPLANMTALNFQNYYIGDLTESDDAANQFIIRYAQPFNIGESLWLLRASFPMNTFPIGPGRTNQTGLGDINVFAAYLFDTGNPAVSFGFGPQVTVPSASDDLLGSEQWSAGFANVLFDGRNKKFQYGYLLTWQTSFAGEENRAAVDVGAFQPFAFYQLGGGNYLRAAPIWTYNFENDNYSMPMGIGFGKVVKKYKTVYNFFVEPQFSVADRGAGQPDWQIYAACNLQFLN